MKFIYTFRLDVVAQHQNEIQGFFERARDTAATLNRRLDQLARSTRGGETDLIAWKALADTIPAYADKLLKEASAADVQARRFESAPTPCLTRLLCYDADDDIAKRSCPA